MRPLKLIKVLKTIMDNILHGKLQNTNIFRAQCLFGVKMLICYKIQQQIAHKQFVTLVCKL
ncbi:hypothetical protein pb186bvf_001816 [Paramecium bursaria]